MALLREAKQTEAKDIHMNELAERTQMPAPTVVEDLIARGDLSKLTPQQRVVHFRNVCQSLGLNYLTEPFQYITLNGKLKLYAKRDATDQLRKINGISLSIVRENVRDGLLTIHVRATDKTNRTDEDYGVVPIGVLKGEAAANATMKAITKAKRRVTLSIAGLGWLDETEIDPSFTTPPEETQEVLGKPHERATLQEAAENTDTGPAPTEEAPPAPVSEGERWATWAEQIMERVRACATADDIDNVIARNVTRLASYQRHDAAAYQRLVDQFNHRKAALAEEQ
jgi:hypothetical protein